MPKRVCITVLCAASLVLSLVSPAAADVLAAEGAGAGGDYPEGVELDMCPPNVLTASVESYRLIVDHTGTYEGTDSNDAPVVYLGGTRVTVDAPAHVISPLGTHTEPCSVVPALIPVDVTIEGDDGVGKVDCEGEGDMIRVSSVVTIEFTGDCTVKGNVPLADGDAGTSEMQHLMEGELTPCLEDPVTLTNPCDGLTFPEPDPGSLYVGAYEAVATTP